jgi:hypothetical protein
MIKSLLLVVSFAFFSFEVDASAVQQKPPVVEKDKQPNPRKTVGGSSHRWPYDPDEFLINPINRFLRKIGFIPAVTPTKPRT